MVSFFGIRLGGDKKKTQKNLVKQPPQKWNRIDQNTLGQGQYFGPNQAASRPQFPNALSRPGTSQSTATTPSNWRAVFSNPAMSSSMTDLAPPSMGALRHNASESNLRTNFAGGSTTSLALPASLGGTGARPGTPSRPTTSKAEWVNPLHVHFCKSTSDSRPGTPATAGAPPKSPLSQFEFDWKPAPVPTEPSIELVPGVQQAEHQPTAERHGYPSPPGSDRDSDGVFSPANSKPTSAALKLQPSTNSRSKGPSALRKVDQVTTSLPSPTPSSPLAGGDDKPDTPLIRNVPARRDTLAFHQPRRLSVKMEFDDERQEKARKTQHIEGFRGNFADFDFGANVKPPSSDMSTAVSTDTSWGERPSFSTESTRPRERVQSPSITDSHSQRSVRSPESPMSRPSVSTSASAMSSHNGRPESPIVKAPAGMPREMPRRIGPPPAAAGAHRGSANAFGWTSPPRGFNSRFDAAKQTRAPPPRPLFATHNLASHDDASTNVRSPYGPPPDQNNYVRNDMEPPRRPRSRPPSSPFSRPPMVGDFPKSNGLPRGRQPERPRSSVDDNDNGDDSSVYDDDPAWPEFDPASPRYSAMPAPLATPRSDPTRSPAFPPRLPSPVFPSFENSISTSGDDLARSFELHFDAPPSGGFIPSVEQRPGSRTGDASPKRVEAKKAPPRPAVMTLPSSSSGKDLGAMRSPVEPRFQGAFI
ncbi:hypothetical protein JDV02_000321 [Purpureocillium takamizusanense]|uniref:Uncharacterized protein n=1 Tax=Purpureocillium takamizusanense TaxID=2060973 RepID=A0A9Q8V5E4_9HYPO|nr:uncharacterized protein JDV02_000321 [Purpureocillium takamizusanense]UNI13593.1 hypothetical protein JDV02_000321 [Purpureocillium takamizusanense]